MDKFVVYVAIYWILGVLQLGIAFVTPTKIIDNMYLPLSSETLFLVKVQTS